MGEFTDLTKQGIGTNLTSNRNQDTPVYGHETGTIWDLVWSGFSEFIPLKKRPGKVENHRNILFDRTKKSGG